MSKLKKSEIFKWSFLGLCFLFAFIFSLRFLPKVNAIKPFAQPKANSEFFKASEADKAYLELVELSDSAPLYLTTAYNYSDFESEIDSPNIGQMQNGSENSETAISVLRSNFDGNLEKYPLINSLQASFAYFNFLGENASDKIGKISSECFANLRVRLLNEKDVAYIDRYKLASISAKKLWTPFSLSVIIGDDGAPSVPLLLSSSGVEALDEELTVLVNKKVEKMNLKKGYYEFLLTP